MINKNEINMNEETFKLLDNHESLSSKDYTDDEASFYFDISNETILDLTFFKYTITVCILQVNGSFLYLHHIKTLDQFKELYKALSGKEF